MAHTTPVAVIGLGNIGKVVATNLIKTNQSFFVSERDLSKAKAFAGKLGVAVQAVDISTAVKNADILILAIPFGAIKQFVTQYATYLKGKIIIDPSNPIAPAPGGGFEKIIGRDESAGETNNASLPEGVILVKAMGTLSAASLANEAFRTPEASVLFYATDNVNVTTSIEQLIRNIGFEPLYAGGISQSIRLEVFGDLHEFGALGKTVTLSEAKSKL